MVDVTEALKGATVPCSFPGCGSAVPVEKAQTPSLKAIAAANKRSVTLEALVASALCGRHAHVAKEEGLRLFSFKGSVQELVRRGEERREAKGFFGRFKAEDTRGNGKGRYHDPNPYPKLKRGEARKYAQ